MSISRDLRELLFADMALMLGLAPSRDVAAALQRYWDDKEDQETSVAQELRRIAELDDDAVAQIEAGVRKLLDQSGGDPKLALSTRGGIDPGLQMMLAGKSDGMTRALAEIKHPDAQPLRPAARHRYREFQPLAQGGMGIVYLALDTELNRQVAFKVVRPDSRSGSGSEPPPDPSKLTPPADHTPDSKAFEELKARFLQEAWVTSALEHPGVVPVYELGTTVEGIPYYTMRYFRGKRTLKDAIEKATSFAERLPLLEPFLKICDAIGYAHSRDVIHRDLKPDNIVLGEFGEAVVLDWGLCKMKGRPDVAASRWQEQVQRHRDATELKTVAGALGTPGYMAPECLVHRDAVDEQSDLYSLGAILFEILTGESHFEFETFGEYVTKCAREEPRKAHEVDPDVPEPLSRVAGLALAKEKADRYVRVEALANSLRGWRTSSAMDREAEGLYQTAVQALELAGDLEGFRLQRQLERAAAACDQALRLRQEHRKARDLRAEISRRQAEVRGRRESRLRRGALLRIGGVAAGLLVVAALFVASQLDERRKEAEESAAQARRAESRAAAERDQAETERARAEDALARANLAAARERQAAERAQGAEREAQRILGGSFALLSRSFLDQKRPEAAFLAAAKSLAVSPTRRGWEALTLAAAAGPTPMRSVGPGIDARHLAIGSGPRGQRLYAATGDGRIEIWQLRTGEHLGTLPAHGGGVESLVVHPDGHHLFVGGRDGAIRMWDVRKGKIRRRFRDAAGTSPVLQLALIDGGRLLVARHRDRDSPRVWTVARPKDPAVDLGGHQHKVILVAGAAGTKHVVGVTVRGQFVLWTLPKYDTPRHLGPAMGPTALAMTEDGKRFAYGTDRGLVVAVDITPAETTSVVAKARLEDRVHTLVFSKDAKTLTASGGPEVLFLEGSDLALSRVLLRHGSPTVALAHRGRTVASASLDGTLVLLDTKSETRIERTGPAAPIRRLRLSADGNRLYVLANGLHVRDAKALWRISDHDTHCDQFELIQGEYEAVLLDRDGHAELRGPDGGTSTIINDEDRVPVTEVARWGPLLYFGDVDGTLWAGSQSDAAIRVKIASLQKSITALAARGTRIVAASEDGSFGTLDPQSDAKDEGLRLFRKPGNLAPVTRTVLLGPKGERAYAGDEDGAIRVWDTQTRRLIATWKGHAGAIRALALNAAGDRLYSGDVVADGQEGNPTICAWNTKTGEVLRIYAGHERGHGGGGRGTTSLVVTAERLFSGGRDGVLRQYELGKRPTGHTLDVGRDAGIFVTRLGRLVAATRGRMLRILDLKTGRVLKNLGPAESDIQSVAIAPDGDRVFAGAEAIQRGRISGEAPLKELGRSLLTTYALAVSPDGTSLYAGSEDDKIHVFDLETGKESRPLWGRVRGATRALAFVGSHLCSGHEEGQVGVWDPKKRTLVAALEAHRGRVTGLAVAEDGGRLVSAGSDEVIQVWDLNTIVTAEEPDEAKPRTSFRGHAPVQISADGRYVCYRAADGMAEVRDLTTRRRVAVLSAEGPFAFSPGGNRLYAGAGKDGIRSLWMPWLVDHGDPKKPRVVSRLAEAEAAFGLILDGFEVRPKASRDLSMQAPGGVLRMR